MLRKGVRIGWKCCVNWANFSVDIGTAAVTLTGSLNKQSPLNSEFCKQALAKVGNPNILVNLVSRRVRQLTSGAGAMSRPLVADIGNLGAADIALREIIEGKIGFDMPEELTLAEPAPKRRKKH